MRVRGRLEVLIGIEEEEREGPLELRSCGIKVDQERAWPARGLRRQNLDQRPRLSGHRGQRPCRERGKCKGWRMGGWWRVKAGSP